MHSSFTLAALALAAALATTFIHADNSVPVTKGPNATPAVDISNSPRLVRRQVGVVPAVAATAAVGSVFLAGDIAGSVGVHKSKNNAKIAANVQNDLDTVERAVERLEANENQIRSLVQLQRRLVGTTLGAVGIHKSKKLRKQITVMVQQVVALRNRVNELLEQEGLQVTHPIGEFDFSGKRQTRRRRRKHQKKAAAAARLQRRQLGLGLILGPVAAHKANHDRHVLQMIGTVIRSITEDLPQIKQAQSAKMAAVARARRAPAPVVMRSSGRGRMMGNAPSNGRRVSITQVHFN